MECKRNKERWKTEGSFQFISLGSTNDILRSSNFYHLTEVFPENVSFKSSIQSYGCLKFKGLFKNFHCANFCQ